MADRQPPRPTDAELAILAVLWERGPSTVRDVHDELNRHAPTGYTTVLKMLQIMADKGLVRRNEKQRAQSTKPPANRKRSASFSPICSTSLRRRPLVMRTGTQANRMN
jgi:predicted transcriptional regulator